MSEPFVKSIFLVPCCDSDLDRIEDLLESIRYFNARDYLVVCVNDCKDEEAIRFIEERTSSDFVSFRPHSEPDWRRDTRGSLFCKKYHCIDYILGRYRFEYLVGVDTDALFTGPDLMDRVEAFFKRCDPKIGLIGSYKIRADGQKRARWKWALYMLYLAYGVRKMRRNPFFWKEMVPAARRNGYKLGEHVLGGSFVFTYECLKSMLDLFPYEAVRTDRLHEIEIKDDIILSMLAYSAGYRIGDFGRPEDPMAIALRSLPLAKEEITRTGKTIIHSVKSGRDGESEEDLRGYFKSLRR